MRTMTLDRLIEDLTQLRDEAGGHAEVRLAHQPFHPFEYAVGDVVAADLNAPRKDDDAPNPNAEPCFVVYIGEADQLGTLPEPAREALSW